MTIVGWGLCADSLLLGKIQENQSIIVNLSWVFQISMGLTEKKSLQL